MKFLLFIAAALAQTPTVDIVVSDSAKCTKECIDVGKVFCQERYDKSQGQCCNKVDLDCQGQVSGLCTSDMWIDEFKYFACPFKTQVCGAQTTITASKAQQDIQSQSGFTTDRVCFYEISAPKSASSTELFQVQITSVAGT